MPRPFGKPAFEEVNSCCQTETKLQKGSVMQGRLMWTRRGSTALHGVKSPFTHIADASDAREQFKIIH